MLDRYSITAMTNTLILVSTEIGMLLGVDGLELDHKDYALYFVMLDMWQATPQPNQSQVTRALGAWLRYYSRLVKKLKYGDLRHNMEHEFWKLSDGYERLLERVE